MDASRFDGLSRSLAEPPTRRGAVLGLAGLVAAGLLGRLGLADVAAKKKGDKKRKGKKCPPCRKKKHGQCNKAKKPDGTPCGTGKTCQSGKCRLSCPVPCAGGDCSSGACVCPGGTERCGDACLPLCGAMKARDALTCGCCGTGGASCTGNGDCCAGHDCVLPGPGGTCVAIISDRAVKANVPRSTRSTC